MVGRKCRNEKRETINNYDLIVIEHIKVIKIGNQKFQEKQSCPKKSSETIIPLIYLFGKSQRKGRREKRRENEFCLCLKHMKTERQENCIYFA